MVLQIRQNSEELLSQLLSQKRRRFLKVKYSQTTKKKILQKLKYLNQKHDAYLLLSLKNGTFLMYSGSDPSLKRQE